MNELIPKILPIVPLSLKGNILSQINKRKIIMKNIRNYSAIAAIIAAFVSFPFLMASVSHAKAVDFIEESIIKIDEVKNMIIRYSMRNTFTYNPDVIDMNSKMNDVRGSIIFENPQSWKFENKNKWYIFDGEKSYFFSNNYKGCNVKSKVDTFNLGRFNAMFLKSNKIMEAIHQLAKNKKAILDMQRIDDSVKITIKYKVKSIDKSRFMIGDIFGWYNNNLKTSFITDCKHVYVFNKENKLLQRFEIWVYYNNKYISILKSNRIVYNSNIDKDKIINIPNNIEKYGEKTILTNISSKEAVVKILNDLRNDSTLNWGERTIFYGYKLKLDFKKLYGLIILEVGESYKTANYEGEIVPVKFKLRNGIIKSTDVKLIRLHKKNKNAWILDGGI